MKKSREARYEFRKLRTRSKVVGTPERPRLSVYKSLRYVYAQIIDDSSGRTLAAASSKEKGFASKAGIEAATKVGSVLGKRAIEKGISQVVFDRGARRYHGSLKALADGSREAGLKF